MRIKDPDVLAISNLLAEMIAKKKEINLSEITPESDLKSLGLDSMDILDLIFTAEYKFDVNFPKEFGEINTLNDVSVLTYQLMQEKV